MPWILCPDNDRHLASKWMNFVSDSATVIEMLTRIRIFSFNPLEAWPTSMVCLALVANLSIAATMEDAFKDGESFGKNQNSSTNKKVNSDNASTSVPKYSTTAPE